MVCGSLRQNMLFQSTEFSTPLFVQSLQVRLSSEYPDPAPDKPRLQYPQVTARPQQNSTNLTSPFKHNLQLKFLSRLNFPLHPRSSYTFNPTPLLHLLLHPLSSATHNYQNPVSATCPLRSDLHYRGFTNACLFVSTSQLLVPGPTLIPNLSSGTSLSLLHSAIVSSHPKYRLP